ncbi:hypothetical protein AZH53_01060 [Methanomicrobiaceae archaeon CYW5]|uniref:hypothetical protein n=1 Tax=Methanovulcanius yangii TaxID=1789227 RepID=UPI0029CA67E4|nr:hypothetical protein [Methanovulcanius yangii]MBT8507018.1 hypothetical protein [Methanovulcanius yangii]
MDAEKKVIAGGLVTALSIVVAGVLIGARILGATVPYAGYVLILCAVVVVTGVMVMNRNAGGEDGVSP